MYNGKRMPVKLPPPYLSQHTTEVGVFYSFSRKTDLTAFVGKILKELSYTDEEITILRKNRIV